MAVGLAVVGNGAQEHANLLYYVISVVVIIACLVAAVLAFWIVPPHWLDQQLAVASVT